MTELNGNVEQFGEGWSNAVCCALKHSGKHSVRSTGFVYNIQRLNLMYERTSLVAHSSSSGHALLWMLFVRLSSSVDDPDRGGTAVLKQAEKKSLSIVALS